MMRFKFISKMILPVIFLTILSIAGQDRSGDIYGSVIDKATKEGLPNVNIYFSKTTIGTTTDNNGLYKIKNIPAGRYTLVVSMIGYEPGVRSIKVIKDSSQTINFFLEPKTIELSAVEISADLDEYEKYLSEQYEYMRIFKKYFLGSTKFSDRCRILNQDKITFTKNANGNIKAECPEPVIIMNKALGYKVECLLDYFTCNEQKESVQMLFYPKFSELEPADDAELNLWKENRREAYLSSLRRFLLSVINNDDESKNYGLFLTEDRFETPKVPRARLLYGSERISKVDSLTNTVELSFEGYLLVYNNVTKESSWIFLPYGDARISLDGYVENPLDIIIYDAFAKLGIAGYLPDNLQLAN